MRRPLKRSGGFTLIEFLTAITIAAIFVSSIGLSYRVVGRGADVVEARGTQAHELYATEQFVRRLVEQVFPAYQGSGNARRLHFFGQPQRLVFATRVPTYHDLPGVYEVTLKFDGADGESAFETLYRPLREPAHAPISIDKTLLQTVSALSFQYARRRDGETIWMHQWTDSRELPRAVKIRLTHDGKAHEWLIPIRTQAALNTQS